MGEHDDPQQLPAVEVGDVPSRLAPIRRNRLLAVWATTRVWLLSGSGMRTRSLRISMGV
ncbi:hypothetical protein RB628_29865 [Streptomyces sp. ADMS]|uniref:hypothetical protein n=1 Tax=Streptomyces sp. ADMS TaxID=3071415 RepID=UPI00296E3D2D|nr:hypothetical protein [Streptomyces sp. ADMS]MDW4909435.1 hypothetical protein [Streptomyces sp. ADMS]